MRVRLFDVVVMTVALLVLLLLAWAVGPQLEEPDPRTWPRLPWPDGDPR